MVRSLAGIRVSAVVRMRASPTAAISFISAAATAWAAIALSYAL
jgi:hypothetical protein